MKIKFYLSELFFLSIIPLLITGFIMYLLMRATAGLAMGYFLLFAIGPIGVPLAIIIFLITFFIIRKKLLAKKFNIFRSFGYTILIIIIIIVIFSSRQAIRETRIDGELADLPIVKEAIYTNNKSLCDNLSSMYGEACRISFEKSYAQCQKSFRDNKKESSYLNDCIEHVLYLTDDLSGCEAIHRKDLCRIVYDNKKAVYALIKKDKSLCQKITTISLSKECLLDVDKLLNSNDTNLIYSFEDGRWFFMNLKYRYDLFKAGKINL